MPFDVSSEADIDAMSAKANQQSSEREFSIVDNDAYRLDLPTLGITFEADRLRRDHHELVGELCVRCDLPGVHTIDGVLSVADFNFSSLRARSTHAKFLAERANIKDIDWLSLMEEFCHRVNQADRAGQPAVDLRTLPTPDSDGVLEIEGFHLLLHHPSILFGDGGASKSYLALYLIGRLAERGMAVALFDWELAGEDHRVRLGRLFPNGMPRIHYIRVERPLVHEVDRLKRIVRENNVQFSVFDSVAFACDGPPESAEIAGKYFRTARQIGGGSLHIAHVNKSENADQKPFGSTFWHNGARCSWYIEKSDETADSDILKIGLFNRKANLGRLRPPIGFTFTFSDDRTTVRRTEVANTSDLAGLLSVRQRMAHLLRRGAMTPEAIAEEIEADVKTVKREVRRYKLLFTVIEGGRIALLEKAR
jgi:hypothetical protein